MTLTKRELVMRISEETGLIQSQVFEVVQKILNQITESLAKGDKVELRNFGVFDVKIRKAKVGRNPKKPENEVPIPARAMVKFKAGNPPYLGSQALSGTYGHAFLSWVKCAFAPTGSVDLVTYFFRRIFDLIIKGGFQALISTNTIAQGSAREAGLDIILQREGVINFAFRSMKWPGRAAVEVALIAIHKGAWSKPFVLENREVSNITAYLDDSESLGIPHKLTANEGKSFQGSIVLGTGFIIETAEAENLFKHNPKNRDVIIPYLNGDDLNSRAEQLPSRWVINFRPSRFIVDRD
jgi:nucleoid DNA-binding protein